MMLHLLKVVLITIPTYFVADAVHIVYGGFWAVLYLMVYCASVVATTYEEASKHD